MTFGKRERLLGRTKAREARPKAQRQAPACGAAALQSGVAFIAESMMWTLVKSGVEATREVALRLMQKMGRKGRETRRQTAKRECQSRW